MADRFDRPAACHAHESGPGDRRLPEGVFGQGARGHRAAEDAADRRQGGRPRHHGQPSGRREMDPNAPGHLPLEAILLRRHAPAPPAKKWPGTSVRLKLQEIVDAEDKQHPLSDDQLVAKLAEAGHHGRPPHGHQVSQGDGHSQFPPTPRLGRRRKTRRRVRLAPASTPGSLCAAAPFPGVDAGLTDFDYAFRAASISWARPGPASLPPPCGQVVRRGCSSRRRGACRSSRWLRAACRRHG